MIRFITLTNSGYIDYTLNCLKSLENIQTKIDMYCYCIGKEGVNRLKKNGYNCELIDQETNSEFQIFRKGNWSNITYNKFKIIYDNLLNYDYVLFSDGDIVYENNCIFDYLSSNIKDNDLLIQNDSPFINNNDDTQLCSGFMFIKSNQNTLSFFDPDKMKDKQNEIGWDDQVYINENKNNIKYNKLPLELFPTGKYYYTHHNKIKPYLIHFNWVIGHEKKAKMVYFNKWLLT